MRDGSARRRYERELEYNRTFGHRRQMLKELPVSEFEQLVLDENLDAIVSYLQDHKKTFATVERIQLARYLQSLVKKKPGHPLGEFNLRKDALAAALHLFGLARAAWFAENPRRRRLDRQATQDYIREIGQAVRSCNQLSVATLSDEDILRHVTKK